MDRLKFVSLSPVFAILLVFFMAILAFFYNQSIQAVETVLSQQIEDANEKLAIRLSERYEWLDRESKMLSRNRSIRGIFDADSASNQSIQNEISKFITWFRQNAELDYLTIIYTNDKGQVVFDSELSGISNVSGMSNELAPTTNTYTEAIFTAFQYTDVPQDSELTIRVLKQNASDDFLILRRATNMRGHNGVLFAVLSWQAFVDMSFSTDLEVAFFNSQNSALIYASDRDIASVISSDWSHSTVSEFDYEQERYLYQIINSKTPWDIATFINTTRYVEKPQRLGRITLAASALFIAISASIILFLIRKVRQHNDDLEKANNSILQQNDELQKARIVVEEHNKMLEEELTTASSMQTKLMPTEDPKIEGLSISGFCRPASHVGGDFYQYYRRPNGDLSIVLADVTGHGMEAAIPNVLFGGMLDNMMDSEVKPVELCTRLNTSLYRSLEPRTFVCFSMGIFDNQSKVLNITNGGCPYPYYYSAASGIVREIEIDAFPLGVRQGSEYSILSLPLESEDRIVFCSDGIVEASNEAGDIYGFDRVRLLIETCCRDGLSSRELIDQLISDVDSFRNGQEQEDDQTVVALHITD